MKALAILICSFIFQVQIMSQDVKTVKKVVSEGGFKKQVEYSYYKKGREIIYHGLYTTYDYKGKVVSQENYKDGKLDGVSKFYKNGVIEREINYSQSKLDGSYKEYNGKTIISDINYKKGILQGKYIRYYPQGQMMVEGYQTGDSLMVEKYGFTDGSYALVKRDEKKVYYNLYNSSGNLILSTKDTIVKFEKLKDCPFESTIIRYPAIMAELGLEGIVILKLWVSTDGKLKKIEPIIGFDDVAIQDAIRSIRKLNCFGTGIKDGAPTDYTLIQIIKYELKCE